MKGFLFLFLIYCFFEGCKASNAAGGFEWLYFYYAYKLDHTIAGGDAEQMDIAWNFRGHPRLATFNEFVKHASTNKKGAPPFRPVAGGNTVTPDLLEVGRNFMIDSEVGPYNLNKMLFAYKQLKKGDQVNHSTILNAIADVVEIRSNQNQESMEPKEISGIMNSLKRTIHYTHQNRVRDDAVHLLEDIRKTSDSQPEPRWVIVEKSVETDSGSRYQALDVRESVLRSRNKGLDPLLVAQIAQFAINYKHKDRKAIRHHVHIDTSKQILDRFEAASQDC